ncbi:hypothetical protein JZ751_014174, partial [Albula glossodonta]
MQCSCEMSDLDVSFGDVSIRMFQHFDWTLKIITPSASHLSTCHVTPCSPKCCYLHSAKGLQSDRADRTTQ